VGSVADRRLFQIFAIFLRRDPSERLAVYPNFYREPPLRVVAVPRPSGDQAAS
jgi:hypothetical protein